MECLSEDQKQLVGYLRARQAIEHDDVSKQAADLIEGLATANASHAGQPVTWERLRTAHSAMMGTEPWHTLAPNEGHRFYRQTETEACYMCAALAMIDRLTGEKGQK